MITGLLSAVFTFLAILLVAQVVLRRMKYRVSLGDGGEVDLNRYMRAHGNFIENVPLALILMFLAEYQGAASWFLYAMGGVLLVGRVFHYIGLTTGKGYGACRKYGVALTFVSFLMGAGHALGVYISSVF